MRARNMQSLTDDIKRKWPGVTIFGVGDAAHKLSVSDHNEDDTPGSRAAQSDADNNPEHRAIDVMLGPEFSKADGDALVQSLLKDPEARKRLQNIIWYRGIWSRSWGWTRRDYTGSDPHTNHPHISGWAGDDENGASWPAVTKGVDMTEMFPRYGENHDGVEYLQFQLHNLGYNVGAVDGDYGDKTAAALKKFVSDYNGKVTDGKRLTPTFKIYIDAKWPQRFGKEGPRGPQGEPGEPGKDGQPGPPGELKLPTTLVFKGTVEQGS